MLGGLAARLYQVQVTEGARYATLAEENRISARLIAPPRGRILDRFGTVVAGNRLNWRALLIAEQTTDVDRARSTASRRIVPLADHERARIEREVHRHRRFIPVMVREFLDLGGDGARSRSTRPICRASWSMSARRGCIPTANSSPTSSATSRRPPRPMLPTIRCWRCPASGSGAPAWRKLATSNCAAVAGAVQLEVNALGRVIRELDRQEGEPGEDVGLTIDTVLHSRCCAGSATKAPAPWCWTAATARSWRWRTNPSFDPSPVQCRRVAGAMGGVGAGQAHAADQQAIAGVYAPGSTFKMAVAMAALESRSDLAGRPCHCPGYLDLGDARFHCWRKGGHGPLDLRGGLKNSCDVFFYETAQARRDRPDRGDGAPVRSGHRAGDRPAGRAQRPDPDARVAHRSRPSLEHRRHRRSRHRPGLHPGDAAAARDLRRARAPPGARCEPHLTRKLAGELQPGSRAHRLAQSLASPTARCTWCATACGRW